MGSNNLSVGWLLPLPNAVAMWGGARWIWAPSRASTYKACMGLNYLSCRLCILSSTYTGIIVTADPTWAQAHRAWREEKWKKGKERDEGDLLAAAVSPLLPLRINFQTRTSIDRSSLDLAISGVSVLVNMLIPHSTFCINIKTLLILKLLWIKCCQHPVFCQGFCKHVKEGINHTQSLSNLKTVVHLAIAAQMW